MPPYSLNNDKVTNKLCLNIDGWINKTLADIQSSDRHSSAVNMVSLNPGNCQWPSYLHHRNPSSSFFGGVKKTQVVGNESFSDVYYILQFLPEQCHFQPLLCLLAFFRATMSSSSLYFQSIKSPTLRNWSAHSMTTVCSVHGRNES